MLGWEFEENTLSPEDMDHVIKIHNANNESAWQEVIIIIPKPLFSSAIPHICILEV